MKFINIKTAIKKAFSENGKYATIEEAKIKAPEKKTPKVQRLSKIPAPLISICHPKAEVTTVKKRNSVRK
ncbi:MAG: hypothetical protein ACOX2F_10080 [bacterium]